MGRKLLILMGSPREKGNSAALAKRAAAGGSAAGAEVESVCLNRLDIHPCEGCDTCKKLGEFCTIQDDMQAIYPKLLAADALILASPIYWFTYSAQLKLCIDRWYGLWNHSPHFLRGKPVGILLAYGDTNLETSGGINAVRSFETMFRFLGAPIAAVIHGSLMDPGDAENNPALMEAAYLLGSRLAGKTD